jgi:hypothetical protein
VPADIQAAEAIEAVSGSHSLQPEALTSVHALDGEGRLCGVAIVDLDAVRLSKPRGLLDPAQLLRGRVPVAATGLLTSKDGEFRFLLESATVAGFDVPKSLLQELVAYYTKSASHPEGYSLDAPFTLSGGIRQITVESGRAIVIQ